MALRNKVVLLLAVGCGCGTEFESLSNACDAGATCDAGTRETDTGVAGAGGDDGSSTGAGGEPGAGTNGTTNSSAGGSTTSSGIGGTTGSGADDAGGDSSIGGAPGSAGETTTDGGAMAGAGADGTGGSSGGGGAGPTGCHVVDNTAPLAVHRIDPDPFSFVPQGGAIAPGMYHLRELVYYGGTSGGCATDVEIYNTRQYVPTSSATGFIHMHVGNVTGSVQYTISGTSYSTSTVCGNFANDTYGYTARENELLLHEVNACAGNRVVVFERQ
jgi:hypothetical protein